MLPRTGSLTHLIVGTLLAVSTAVLTKSNPAFPFRSHHCPIEAVKISLEIEGSDMASVIASLDLIPHQ
jgi:hypothetical protein